MNKLKILTILFASALLVACGKVDVSVLDSSDKIVVIGDDLVFGNGGKGTSFPQELGTMIGNWVVNSGVDGDSSANTNARVEAVLAKDIPSHLMIAVGAVDMQRKVPDEEIKHNLQEILDKAKASNVIPIIVGVPRPSTPGSNLKLTDASFYEDLAKHNGVVYLKNPISDVQDQPKFRANTTLLTAEGYIEVAKKIALKMKDVGFIKEIKGSLQSTQ